MKWQNESDKMVYSNSLLKKAGLTGLRDRSLETKATHITSSQER